MARRTLVVIVALIGWTLVYLHVAKMDERWFGPSLSATKGLAFYQFGRYREAADAYRSHIRQVVAGGQSGDPAWEAILREDFDAASDLSNAALAEAPDAVDPALNLAEVALSRKQDVEARGWVARVLSRSPDDPDALLLLAVINARDGRDDEAIAAFHRVLRTGRVESRITVFLWVLQAAGELLDEPSGTRRWCTLAQVFRYLRIYDPANGRVAIRYARRAIKAGDYPADAHFAIGVINAKEGREDQALASFRNAVEADPHHAEAFRWAATIYADRGDLIHEYQMARAAFDAASDDPFYVKPLDYVLVEKLGDIQLATTLFEEKRAVSPGNAKIHARLGYLYGFIGDHERSRASYAEAIDLEPGDPTLYEGLAFEFVQLGAVDDAIASYQHAATLAPTRYQPHAGLAKVLYGLRLYVQARSEYEKAFQQGDQDLNHLTELCALYHVVSMFDEAAACLQEVLARNPRHTLALRLMAETDRNRRR